MLETIVRASSLVAVVAVAAACGGSGTGETTATGETATATGSDVAAQAPAPSGDRATANEGSADTAGADQGIEARHTARLEDTPRHEVAGGELAGRILLDRETTGNADAALTQLEVADGAELPMQRHIGAAELLYIESGGGRLVGLGGEGAELAPGDVVFIPADAAHSLRESEDGEPTIMMQLFAPGGPQRELRGDPGSTERLDTDEVDAQDAWVPSKRAVADAESYSLGGGKGEVAIVYGGEDPADDAAYVGMITAEPGLEVPLHTHAESSELVMVLAGTGTMTVTGEQMQVSAGTAIQVPPGTEHSVAVTGDEPMRALQFYVPAGPEMRFIEAAAAKAEGSGG